MLSREYYTTSKVAELATKWKRNFVGPLAVLEVISPVKYKIKMPPSMKRALKVVDVSKLKAYRAAGSQ